jgi:hypothetical protein
MKQVTKAYKVTDKDMKCNGFQYELGKIHKLTGELSICNWGFHACTVLMDCFSYYDFDPNNRVFEVELRGEIQTHKDSKVASLSIKLIKEISWQEVLTMVNIGKANTGHTNSGNMNSGNRNSGYMNSGYRNSGDMNSGNRNSGDMNSGNRNSGNMNSGNMNSGDRNSGYRNSGYRNSGDRNSGDMNSGNRNSGDMNSGDMNSGDMNSGDMNSGDMNSGDRNSGFFNTNEPKVRAFNQYLDDISHFQYRDLLPYIYLPINEWIDYSGMSDAEKVKYPQAETCGGYLKTYSYKEACQTWWKGCTIETQNTYKALPGFNADIFFEITGIRV